jgi:hypothetical protein
VKNDLLLCISVVLLSASPRLRGTRQLRWIRQKNPQRISDFGELSRVADTSAVFSSSPPRFVKTLKMLTMEPFFTPLLGSPNVREASSTENPCLFRFDRALEASHSKSRLTGGFYCNRRKRRSGSLCPCVAHDLQRGAMREPYIIVELSARTPHRLSVERNSC